MHVSMSSLSLSLHDFFQPDGRPPKESEAEFLASGLVLRACRTGAMFMFADRNENFRNVTATLGRKVSRSDVSRASNKFTAGENPSPRRGESRINCRQSIDCLWDKLDLWIGRAVDLRVMDESCHCKTNPLLSR
eukprot:TRINITY_DN114786_c0_g1_i1.p1 TRINITY_DN114786_c0_g1~~TRINITY_DN114786_c0_g1_i1.p1  ORF type:complete len:134 (-),score=9.59 TRINITY_DN114786_c0_g1_i1:169-570(-)